MTILSIPLFSDSRLLDQPGPDAVFLPGSIPAAIALKNKGINALRTLDFVAAADFQEAWETGMVGFWQLVKASRNQKNAPKLPVWIAYTGYIAYCQLVVFGKLLDAIHARLTINELVVDYPGTCNINTRTIYAVGLNDPWYADAAIEWAKSNNIPWRIVNTCQPIPIHRDFNSDGLRGLFRIFHRYIKDGMLSKFLFFIRVIGALIKKNRLVVLTTVSGRLPKLPDGVGKKIAILDCPSFFDIKRTENKKITNIVNIMFNMPEWRSIIKNIDIFQCVYEKRITASISGDWLIGEKTYRYMSCVTKWTAALGARLALISDCPFSQEAPNFAGFIAQALNDHGGLVVEYQHGGNYTTTVRGSTATLLGGGLADLFLEWGETGRYEHETYGLTSEISKFAAVGCFSVPPVLPPARKAAPQIINRPIKIVYAPTLLSIVTLGGINMIWDDYLQVLDEILGRLDRSGAEIYVSQMVNEEMRVFLALHEFKNLRFQPMSFSELTQRADLLIVDSFAGSPTYEATVTDKPVIAFTGLNLINMDPGFMADYRRRCITYDDRESFITGIDALLGNPEDYLRRNQRDVDPTIMMRHFSPLNSERFWGAVSDFSESI